LDFAFKKQRRKNEKSKKGWGGEGVEDSDELDLYYYICYSLPPSTPY